MRIVPMHPDYLAFNDLNEQGALEKVIELNDNHKLDEVILNVRYANNNNPTSAVKAISDKFYKALGKFYKMHKGGMKKSKKSKKSRKTKSMRH